MKIIKLVTISFFTLFLITTSVLANCDLTVVNDLERKKDGAVRLLARDNDLNNSILNKAKDCEVDDIFVVTSLQKEFDYFPFVQTLKQAPAGFTSFISENDSLGIILYEGLASQLDYYLESNNIEVAENRKIKIDGKKTTAIAFIKDTKHLYYKEDILNKAGIDVPTSYSEVLEAAEIIKSKGILEYPLGDLYNNEWQLAVQFVNLYLSLDGKLFKEESAKPIFKNDEGIEALNMMKKYSKFINPELLFGSKETIEESWSSGKIAIGNFWGSQYKNLSTDSNTKTSTALYFNKSVAPASTLWWKGFTVARYVVESEMMAALYTMFYAFNDDTISSFNDDAIWIVDGYENEPKAAGLILNEKAGTPSFPVNPYIALLLVSIGSEISDFIINDTKSKKALKKMEKAYIKLAKNLEYM